MKKLFLALIALFWSCNLLFAAWTDDFVITIKTDQVASNDKTFEIPLNSTMQYDFSVDWGDGNTNRYNWWGTSQLNAKHDYTSAGTYTIRISENAAGGFPHFNAWSYPKVDTAWDPDRGFPKESQKIISVD